MLFKIQKQKNIKFRYLDYWFFAIRFIHLLNMTNTRHLNWWSILTINT